jgi:molybdenum cofactor cytidylyltransferase
MGGQPKPLLPFGDERIIERILRVLAECPLEEIVVVTGHRHEEMEQCLAGWSARTVFNPQYAAGEMLSSIQTGLRSASAAPGGAGESSAALIVLGDQPALERSVVEAVIAAYHDGLGDVIIPSFQMRRGHPLLIGSQHWSAILDLQGQTLRDFMQHASAGIHHVSVDTSSILRDMDTPEDYQRELAAHLSRLPIEQA